MKQLALYTTAFVQAEKDFREWLQILGYAPSTVYGMPNFIREFLHWMEQQAYFLLIDITAETIQQYYHHLKLAQVNQINFTYQRPGASVSAGHSGIVHS